ncbi:hypothetical protein CLV59_108138 [Chitinophaga dinghuensis]|uniref:Natural product n=1 Tax=Chitinophaga dinghuensis TaxID=1539050 RepID=A0A327VRB1_9BACT|nr:hypothetical protein [Chitinophaga dinghuensis]RAJ76619.1 hypothetical protein CLV59_108138 [Chitinophaga dinghuensis]
MKKLKLKALELGARELLSREQLRNILGGDGSDDGGSEPIPCAETTTAACDKKAVRDICCVKYDNSYVYGRCASYAPTNVMRCYYL